MVRVENVTFSTRNYIKSKQKNNSSTAGSGVSFGANLQYKSSSKLRKLFSGLVGDVKEAVDERGVLHIIKTSRKNIVLVEKRFSPGFDRCTEYSYSKDGKKMLRMTKYETNINGEFGVAENYNYNENGEKYYSFLSNGDVYKRAQLLPNGVLKLDEGEIIGGRKLKAAAIVYEQPQVLDAETEQKIIEQARKMMDTMDGYVFKVKRLEAEQLKEKFAQETKDSNDLGLMVLEHPKFESYIESVKDLPTNWARQNLKSVRKFPLDYQPGERPDDVMSLYILESESLKSDYRFLNSWKVKLLEKTLHAGIEKIYEIGLSMNLRAAMFYLKGQYASILSVLSKKFSPKADKDFAMLQDFYRKASINEMRLNTFKGLLSDYNIKEVPYNPKLSIKELISAES